MKKRFVKRSFKRRRSYKKKVFRKKYTSPKPDGAICTKIHGQMDIAFETALGAGTVFLNWAGNGIPTNT